MSVSKEVKKFRERYEDFIGIKKGEHIFKIHSDYFDSIAPFWLKELSQAHQSGIEEGIVKTLEHLSDGSFLSKGLNWNELSKEKLKDIFLEEIIKSLKGNKQ